MLGAVGPVVHHDDNNVQSVSDSGIELAEATQHEPAVPADQKRGNFSLPGRGSECVRHAQTNAAELQGVHVRVRRASPEIERCVVKEAARVQYQAPLVGKGDVNGLEHLVDVDGSGCEAGCDAAGDSSDVRGHPAGEVGRRKFGLGELGNELF